MEVQRLEALLKAMKSECQGQMERQVRACKLGHCPVAPSMGGNVLYALSSDSKMISIRLSGLSKFKIHTLS